MCFVADCVCWWELLLHYGMSGLDFFPLETAIYLGVFIV